MLTRSGMTRLVDRVEEAGLVRRERADHDRRGVFVEITPAGLEKVDEVWADHVASIDSHFGRHLDEDDAEHLVRIWGSLRAGAAQ